MPDFSLWSVGTLGKVHGLKGELYLNLSSDGLERLELGESFFLAPAGTGEPRTCTVKRVGGTDQRPLVVTDLASTREQAIALQGHELLAAGGDLDERPHYRVGDLLGRPLETESGRPVGEVRDVLEAPAHEILVVRTPDGVDVLIPLVDELISQDGDKLVVVDGLLEEPEAPDTPAAPVGEG